MFNEKKVEIKFERPNPDGWFTVVFPNVHDLSVSIDIWFRDASDWVNEQTEGHSFSCFAHGRGKESERISPVFFFKERMDAMRMMWRFSGELVK